RSRGSVCVPHLLEKRCMKQKTLLLFSPSSNASVIEFSNPGYILTKSSRTVFDPYSTPGSVPLANYG
ncbi:hypothetical protein, partial [Coleofasciculus sp.]|uniref:hypothetical protein n=1 Tax=Coleofasciculus sp. TaxID=3100458 RepID=UPI003A42662A